jgi:hypothetical protein
MSGSGSTIAGIAVTAAQAHAVSRRIAFPHIIARTAAESAV